MLDAEVHGFGILVNVVAPGLFRTAMSEGLTSYRVADDSVYAPAFEALRARTPTGSTQSRGSPISYSH